METSGKSVLHANSTKALAASMYEAVVILWFKGQNNYMERLSSSRDWSAELLGANIREIVVKNELGCCECKVDNVLVVVTGRVQEHRKDVLPTRPIRVAIKKVNQSLAKFRWRSF